MNWINYQQSETRFKKYSIQQLLKKLNEVDLLENIADTVAMLILLLKRFEPGYIINEIHKEPNKNIVAYYYTRVDNEMLKTFKLYIDKFYERQNKEWVNSVYDLLNNVEEYAELTNAQVTAILALYNKLENISITLPKYHRVEIDLHEQEVQKKIKEKTVSKKEMKPKKVVGGKRILRKEKGKLVFFNLVDKIVEHTRMINDGIIDLLPDELYIGNKVKVVTKVKTAVGQIRTMFNGKYEKDFVIVVALEDGKDYWCKLSSIKEFTLMK